MELSKLITFVGIALMGAMSPGPDFAIVVKNCLRGKFREGFKTSLGVGAAILIHVSYCVLGVALIIRESPFLFRFIQYGGAAYLFYLGVILLREPITEEDTLRELASTASPQQHKPFLNGFLTNLLNPKATLFILSLFTQFIDPDMRLIEKAFMGSLIAIVACSWFILLSYLITHRFLQKHFVRFRKIITRSMGCVLILLAVYIGVSATF